MNTKAASERYQRQVQELSKQPGNAQCADCGGRYPRWASWNLGIFLCVNCAGVHRKMGTHITKVKSLTLDTWTKEQVERMRDVGNVKNNAKYNPDERRNRPPANVEEGERNSELERFIFDKYKGRFMNVRPPPVPMKDYPRHLSPNVTGSNSPALAVGRPSIRSATSPAPPPSTTLIASTSSTSSSSSSGIPRSPSMPSTQHPAPPRQPSPLPPTSHASTSLAPPIATVPPRSSSATVQSTSSSSAPADVASSSTAPLTAAANTATPTSSVFDDLLSLQGPPAPPQPPSYLQPNQQMNPWAHLATQQQAVVSPMVMSHQAASPFFASQAPPPPPPPHEQQFTSSNLGAMAFGGVGAAPNAYMQMGQQAFQAPYAYQQHYFAQPQQHQQQQPQQYFSQQQQQQPQQPNPFGSFAHTMMPPSSY